VWAPARGLGPRRRQGFKLPAGACGRPTAAHGAFAPDRSSMPTSASWSSSATKPRRRTNPLEILSHRSQIGQFLRVSKPRSVGSAKIRPRPRPLRASSSRPEPRDPHADERHIGNQPVLDRADHEQPGIATGQESAHNLLASSTTLMDFLEDRGRPARPGQRRVPAPRQLGDRSARWRCGRIRRGWSCVRDRAGRAGRAERRPGGCGSDREPVGTFEFTESGEVVVSVEETEDRDRDRNSQDPSVTLVL